MRKNYKIVGRRDNLVLCPQNFVPNQNSRLCGLHFTINNFLGTPTKRHRKLNWNAEPLSIQNQPHPPFIID